MSALISEAYRKELEQLHREKADFGTSSVMYADMLWDVVQAYRCADMLDYGAGKQALKKAMDLDTGYYAYDPAIPEISATPEPRDLVVCSDVLEHVEVGMVDAVLDDLKRVTKKVGFLAIHLGPALHKLPDGRNAHITQMPVNWWLLKICKRFDVAYVQRTDYTAIVIVTPEKK